MLVIWETMKTTLDLPDELMRTVRIRAVRENRKLKDLVADLLRRGLDETPTGVGQDRHRVRLPLVPCAHTARPSDEMTPGRVATILAEDEARGHA